MNMILRLEIRITESLPEPLLRIFRMTGYALSAALERTSLSRLRTKNTGRLLSAAARKRFSRAGLRKDGKGERMKTLKLRDNFYWVGIVDDTLRVFDIIMYTEFGTSYNSYLMKTGGKTVLFETAKEVFFDEYLEKVQELTDIADIDYLVVSHTEPDHAGSIARLLELNRISRLLPPAAPSAS